MKHLKMFGLAAIATLGLMAFIGAGPASATTLFTNSEHTLTYATGTEIHATLTSGTTAKLTGENKEVLDTCAASTIKGTTAELSGTPLTGGISTLTWGNCSNTTNTVATGSLSIEWTSENTGTVTGSGSEVTVNGIFSTSCTYGTGTGTKLGTITGGTEPKLSINAVGLQKTAGGLLCPAKTGWDAEYTVTAPHALFIGK